MLQSPEQQATMLDLDLMAELSDRNSTLLSRFRDEARDTVTKNGVKEFCLDASSRIGQTWSRLLGEIGRGYDAPAIEFLPRWVLVNGASGPFRAHSIFDEPRVEDFRDKGALYSRGTIYICPQFLLGLGRRWGCQGDIAKYVVLAHESAHHVQKLLGLSLGHQFSPKAEGVFTELQADFMTGVWARDAVDRQGLIRPLEIVGAALTMLRFGDDGNVPRKWHNLPFKSSPRSEAEHGKGAERARHFLEGYNSGSFTRVIAAVEEAAGTRPCRLKRPLSPPID